MLSNAQINLNSEPLKKYLKGATLILIFSVLIYDIQNSSNELKNFKFQVPLIKKVNYATNETNIKHILFWNSWKNSLYWNMESKVTNKDYLKSINCPITNCIFSHDKKLLQHETIYDAIVFNVGNQINVDDLPTLRTEEQIYIMASDESPFNVKSNLKLFSNFFNMTLSYRLSSDVFWNAGLIADIATDGIIAPSKYAKWRKPEIVDDQEILNFVKTSKTRQAAWPMTNCETESSPDHLGMKLQEIMDVDIYGTCGNFSYQQSFIQKSQKFTDMLNSTYKFVFAFENSICIDYMTENVFINMENYVVPILFNGITNMQQFLPPHSYIHVNDFDSINKLVSYLNFLDNNPQEYANYFWWKKYYKIISNSKIHSYCEMCMKINEWSANGKRQEYFEVDHWFNYKTCYNI